MALRPRGPPRVSSQPSDASFLAEAAREDLAQQMRDELLAQPELMRGVRWTVVLSGLGAQLRAGPHGSVDSAALAFAQSSPVRPLQVFLSHSWHAHSMAKSLALLQRHNGFASDVSGVCVGLLMALLDSQKVLPAWRSRVDNSWLNLWSPGGPTEANVRAWTLLGFLLGKVLTLLTWHRLDLCRRHERLFVDKLCIHQTDAELKQQAVQYIGHFLVETEEFLVMLDYTYLQRVWCVFELATFLGLNDSGAVVLCPISLFCANALVPIVTSCVWLGLWTSWSIGLLPWAIEHLQHLIPLIPDTVLLTILVSPWSVLLTVSFTLVLRKFERGQRLILKKLESFCLANAQCCLESDRTFVEGRVRELYGSVERFETFAKQQVQDKLHSLLGPSCEITFLMCFRGATVPVLAMLSDALLTLAEAGASTSLLLHLALGGIVLATIFAPCFEKLVELSSDLSLKFDFSDKHDFRVACLAGLLPGLLTSIVVGHSSLVMGQDSLAKAASVLTLSVMCAFVWSGSLLHACVLPCWRAGAFY